MILQCRKCGREVDTCQEFSDHMNFEHAIHVPVEHVRTYVTKSVGQWGKLLEQMPEAEHA